MKEFKPFIGMIAREAGALTEGDAEEATIEIEDALPKILHLGSDKRIPMMNINPESRGDPMSSMSLTLKKPSIGKHRSLNWQFNINNDKLRRPFNI